MLDLAACRLRARIPLFQLLFKPGKVSVAAACVGDHVERVFGMFGDDSVVDDAAALIQEDGERGGVGHE